MNRFRIRLRHPAAAGPTRLAVAAVAAAAALSAALTGCGTGQIAQTTDQASAVNGTEGVAGHVALRDVHIQATQTGAFVSPGHSVDLVFVATNQSTDTDDELTKISTDIGTVAKAGSWKLPATGVLMVAAPATQDATASPAPKELRSVEDAHAASATLALDKPISNGLTYEFTFDFKEAGPITLAVPVFAGVLAPSTAPQSDG